jgi:hypothetical protein
MITEQRREENMFNQRKKRGMDWQSVAKKLHSEIIHQLHDPFKMYRSADSVVMNDSQNVVSHVPVSLCISNIRNAPSCFEIESLLYIILRGCWFNIVVLNAHKASEEKSDDSKDSFYEELEQVFDHFPKFHIKIVLDFNAKVGRENIFKLTIGNESLQQDSNDNCVRVISFATARALCSHTYTFISMPGLLLMGRHTTRLITCV